MIKASMLVAAIVFAAILSMPIGTSTFAKPPPDFDLLTKGIEIVGSSTNPFVTVAGTAGGTIPSDPSDAGDIYAYVFVLNGGTSIAAVASHDFIDDPAEQGTTPPSFTWHAHSGIALNSNGCITAISPGGTASLSGNTVKITGLSGVTSVDAVKTVVLSTTGNGICVVHVFDVLT